MPELPEVETIIRSLRENIVGKKINAVAVNHAGVLANYDVHRFTAELLGRQITGMARRGKYILCGFAELTLVIHLRMTGRLLYQPRSEPQAKHTHIILTLNDGYDVRFVDSRRFGRLYLVPTGNWQDAGGLPTLGIEPLDAEFNEDYLANKLKNKKSKIKAVLLDQTVIAGMGNIYVDEALHRAGIHPGRLSSSLTKKEIGVLQRSIREVLLEGIANRGTTIRDYVDGSGRNGGFQNFLRVYGREGKPCLTCGQPIKREKLAGRSSYYCTCCQRL